mmetsp:Transcript_7532/g.12795  ORF Transcript_7532/g.12795 Transcript_7532/m.12795 type:complete len:655 (+) Transcript_7532:122-2086(+)
MGKNPVKKFFNSLFGADGSREQTGKQDALPQEVAVPPAEPTLTVPSPTAPSFTSPAKPPAALPEKIEAVPLQKPLEDATVDGSSQADHLNKVGRPRKTSTGYQTDVRHERTPITKTLVTQHAEGGRGLMAMYDSSHSWELGRGGCGSVNTVRHRQSGENFAMKTVRIDGMDGGTIEELRQEIKIQRSLDHPNIVKLIESFEDIEKQRIYIVMELCTGGSLVSRMKTHRYGYGERAAATLLEKMLSAVLYCHRRGFIHRDIKLDNFIYETEAEDAELKLIDFGFACELKEGKEEEMFERLGTLSYMAPELLGQDKRKAYDSSVDMWSLGVVSYMLLCGRRPFHHNDRKKKIRMIIDDPVTFDSVEWNRISAAAKDFCTKLMQKEPGKRMSASDALQHEWIKGSSTLHEVTAADELAAHGEVVEALQSYSRANEIKKLALEAIAFSTPPSKLEELRRIFVEMDLDRSGTLSLDEFRKAMAQQEVAPEQVERIFHSMDLSKAGEVDYSEFISATLSKKASLKTPSIASAFSMLDRDHDGFITKADLTGLVGDSFSSEEVQEMLASPSVGARGGKLAFEDFKFLMLRGNNLPKQVHMQLQKTSMQRWKSEPSALTRASIAAAAESNDLEPLPVSKMASLPSRAMTSKELVAHNDDGPL